MTEYWVSKKQYWCKYCSIFIRDDAPSRRLHETGLKHIGQKERYIRELYKNGDMAKREKAAEAADMARIEASAAAAYAHDTISGAPASRPSVLQRISASASASTSKIRDNKPKDKWANYSTAEQLGFDDEETQKSSYEIEQELKGRAGEVGKWEEVTIEPVGLYSGDGDGAEGAASGSGGKRKWALGSAVDERAEGEEFKLVHDKRTFHDPYDDDWDPATIRKLKVRVKEERVFDDRPASETIPQEVEGGLKREGWTGKLELELNPASSLKEDRGNPKEGMRYDSGVGGWVKRDTEDGSEIANQAESRDDKPDLETEEAKPTIAASDQNDISATDAQSAVAAEAPASGNGAPAASSLFKKRRPAPSSRKK